MSITVLPIRGARALLTFALVVDGYPMTGTPAAGSTHILHWVGPARRCNGAESGCAHGLANYYGGLKVDWYGLERCNGVDVIQVRIPRFRFGVASRRKPPGADFSSFLSDWGCSSVNGNTELWMIDDEIYAIEFRPQYYIHLIDQSIRDTSNYPAQCGIRWSDGGGRYPENKMDLFLMPPNTIRKQNVATWGCENVNSSTLSWQIKNPDGTDELWAVEQGKSWGKCVGPWIVKDLKYDVNAATVSSEIRQLDFEWGDNSGLTTPITQRHAFSETVTDSFSFELSEEDKTTVGTDESETNSASVTWTSPDIPYVGSVSGTYTGEATVGKYENTEKGTTYTEKSETQRSKTSTKERTFEVPGCTVIEVRFVATAGKANVPYTATMAPDDASITGCEYSVNGTWKGVSVSNTRVTGVEMVDPPLFGACNRSDEGFFKEVEGFFKENGVIAWGAVGGSLALVAAICIFCSCKKRRTAAGRGQMSGMLMTPTSHPKV